MAKALGAAFSHARASGKDQSQGAQRRRANAWLKRNGKATISAKVAKGILDRMRAMTTDERADQFNLQALGLTPEQARALAMTGAGKLPKRIPRYKAADASPPKSVQSAARRGLDQMAEYGGEGLTDGAKSRARALAAGKTVSPGTAKRIASFHARHGAQDGPMTDDKGKPTPKAVATNLWGGKGAKRWAEGVSKMGPTLGEVHAPVPGGGGVTIPRVDRKARRKAKRLALQFSVTKGGPGSGPHPGGGEGATALPASTHLEAAQRHMARAQQARGSGDHENANKHVALAHARLSKALGASRQRLSKSAVPVAKRHMVANLAGQLINAAYGADQTQSPEGGFEDRPDVARYLDAQRLVAGIDAETANGAATPTQARAIASAAMRTNMDYYDRTIAGPDRALAGVGGLNLDLGSGQSRERGHLGLDTFPYDYGTVLHDLGMGIPFPDASARAVRLVNTLEELDDYRDDPTPLLQEIQRVLAMGGRLYFQGKPFQDRVDWSKLPGLGVVSHQFSSDGKVLDLVMRRCPVKLPVCHGADTNFLAVDERQPEDLRIAQAVFGDVLPASVCMANLVHKKEHVDVRAKVLKKDTYQHVVLGAVLIPGVVDSQGDVMDAADIEQTAHDFMANARVVGKEHTDTWEGGEVVESYIAPVDMDFNDPSYGPQNIPKGTWVLGVRLPPDSWSQVLDGSFTGFSVGGWGEREDMPA